MGFIEKLRYGGGGDGDMSAFVAFGHGWDGVFRSRFEFAVNRTMFLD